LKFVSEFAWSVFALLASRSRKQL